MNLKFQLLCWIFVCIFDKMMVIQIDTPWVIYTHKKENKTNKNTHGVGWWNWRMNGFCNPRTHERRKIVVADTWLHFTVTTRTDIGDLILTMVDDGYYFHSLSHLNEKEKKRGDILKLHSINDKHRGREQVAAAKNTMKLVEEWE